MKIKSVFLLMMAYGFSGQMLAMEQRPPLVPHTKNSVLGTGSLELTEEQINLIIQAIFEDTCEQTLVQIDGGNTSVYSNIKDIVGQQVSDSIVSGLITQYQKQAYIFFFKTALLNAHDKGGFLLVADVIEIYQVGKGALLEALNEVLELPEIQVLYKRQPTKEEKQKHQEAMAALASDKEVFNRALLSKRAKHQEQKI